jgi:hypothetical protein
VLLESCNTRLDSQERPIPSLVLGSVETLISIVCKSRLPIHNVREELKVAEYR